MASATYAFKEGPNDYYSAEEIAHFLGVHRVTVYRMGERGDLPRLKLGNMVRFPAREINALLHRSGNDAA